MMKVYREFEGLFWLMKVLGMLCKFKKSNRHTDQITQTCWWTAWFEKLLLSFRPETSFRKGTNSDNINISMKYNIILTLYLCTITTFYLVLGEKQGLGLHDKEDEEMNCMAVYITFDGWYMFGYILTTAGEKEQFKQNIFQIIRHPGDVKIKTSGPQGCVVGKYKKLDKKISVLAWEKPPELFKKINRA